MWSLEREGELQTISSDHLFEISGDQRPQSESNFGNLLKIRNCSSGRLNGTLLHCGSHTHPKQKTVTLKVCGMLFDYVLITMVAIVSLQRNQM